MDTTIDIVRFKEALNESWNKDTADISVKEIWDGKNKSLGQCAITSVLVNYYFGGKIYKGDIEGKRYSHFWNILPNGERIDLTKSQFGNEKVSFRNIKRKNVEDLLKNEDLKQRYLLLKERVSKKLDI